MSTRASLIVFTLLLALVLSACGGSPAAVAPTASAGQAQGGASATSGPADSGQSAAEAPATSQRQPAPEDAAKPADPASGAVPPVAQMEPTAPPASDVPAEPTAAAAPVPDQALSATPAVQATPALEEPAAPTLAPESNTVNPFVSTSKDRLSTFSIDVDTASYSNARNHILNGGSLPPPDSVRVEEFVNYFRYDYPSPGQEAFGIAVDGAPSPFGQPGAQIVRVGVQGKRIDEAQRSNASLTFVIDVSGSMQEPARLPLVKQALRLLVDELRPSDRVGIVVYGSNAWVALEHTGVDDKDRILSVIDGLGDGGSTNAEEGLRLGYDQASKHFMAGGINRVILCSDGVANVGATGPEAIRQSIRDYTAQGIYLTTVGFGMGGYNDVLMEQLADDGNGNYAYVDTLKEAQRIFVQNLTSTLQVIAKDVKIQVDFNPTVVAQYRLLGYENRAVADSDFRNDKVDAGEVGAGHSVTALYEVLLTGQGSGTALTVQLRYADPTNAVREIAQPFDSSALAGDFATTTPRFQQAVAVAAFAEKLRGSAYAQNRTLDDVLAIAQRIAPQLPNDPDVQEFVRLVDTARQFAQ
ncbi:MAG TPA: von Willebrand factor type A domain-containing protein [Roseiflexaceae bacterium]|nr:von Willebrand factor type A domain-containing protein [Roseiflexaceae bacterium]